MHIPHARRLIATFVLATFFFAGSAGAEAAAASNYSFTQNLRVGSRGEAVSALQSFLIARGYLSIPSPSGYFGSMTRSAVASWQAAEGIVPASGLFGPLSRARLHAASQSAIAAIPPATVVPSPTTAPSISGSHGLPTRIKIPKLGVDAGFVYTGLTPEGNMDAPTTITEVGWYTGSARPGDKGVSVISGHVAQIRGGVQTLPGVFFTLNQLQIGDTFQVVDDRGTTITFVVRASRLLDPANTYEMFNAADNGAHLNIITCDGIWNAATASFSLRLVIFADAL